MIFKAFFLWFEFDIFECFIIRMFLHHIWHFICDIFFIFSWSILQTFQSIYPSHLSFDIISIVQIISSGLHSFLFLFLSSSYIIYQVSLWCSLPISAFASSNKINALLLIFNQKQNCTSFGNCNQIYTIDKIHIKHVSQRHEDTDGKGHAKRKQYKTYIKSKVGNKSKLSKVRRNCKKNIHGFELL